MYSFASAEGLADDPTRFTNNRSYYSYVETTPNQINSEVNKSSQFLEKEQMKTLSANKINNGNSSMDVIDNELETSGNGVPNTSHNTRKGQWFQQTTMLIHIWHKAMMFMTIQTTGDIKFTLHIRPFTYLLML